MAKRLSQKEIKNIIKFFTEGKSIKELAQVFDCTKLTITRHLKRHIGEDKFKEFSNKSKELNKSNDIKEINNVTYQTEDNTQKKYSQIPKNEHSSGEFLPLTPFTEIEPLNLDIDNTIQKDLSSVPISDIDFPKMVFLIVDKKIELETKFLREFPEWQFLSQEELNRKTIAIYSDIKIAKRFCNKDQKVIKVPNTDVFRIVAPLLLSRGISRIVSDDKLISL